MPHRMPPAYERTSKALRYDGQVMLLPLATVADVLSARFRYEGCCDRAYEEQSQRVSRTRYTEPSHWWNLIFGCIQQAEQD